jgi:hypothetical protein
LELGFDTIGNATLIGYDSVPVLVTDPWIEGSPYFGSWSLSHEIPEEQRAAIRACSYVWFSHGHPDHLNAESLPFFRDRVILLPDHVGRRVQNELELGGFTIEVLPDRTWRRLSPRLRVLSISDYNQDVRYVVPFSSMHRYQRLDSAWAKAHTTHLSDYSAGFEPRGT